MPSTLHSLPKQDPGEPFASPAAGSGLRLIKREENAPAEDAAVELSLRAVLRETEEKDLGFPPSRVPEHMRVKLPLALILPQIHSGRVMLRVQDLRAGVQECFRPAFSKAAAGLLISVPLEEIFSVLPSPALSLLYPASAPVRPGRLSRPPGGSVSISPLSPERRAPPREDKNPVAPAPVSEWSSDVFNSPPQPRPPEGRTASATAELKAEERQRESSPPSSHSGILENGEDLGEPFCAAELCQEPPAFPDAVSGSPEQAEATAPREENQNSSFGARPLPNRLLFKALFPSAPPGTLAGAVECCATLPGVGGCALLASGELLAGGAPPADECRRLAAEAESVLAHLRGLSNSLLCPRQQQEEQGLTLRCGEQWRTFFLEKETVLAAWHSEADFPSGVREKIILTLRELASASTRD